MKKIFLGPPGAGKGTYSSRVSPIRKIPHISTGDIFRKNIKDQTEIGKQVKKILEKGDFVPDELTINMIKERLNHPDAQKGFILDGFPRTITQAQALKELFDIDLVLNLIIPEDILLERALARRICKECGDIYNIADINRKGIKLPPVSPKQEGICDKCEGELYQRADDNKKTILDRLEIYKKQTKPLIDFYTNSGILKNIKITSAPEIMIPKILEILENLEKLKINPRQQHLLL